MKQLCAGQITPVVAELALIPSHGQHLSAHKQRGSVSLSRCIQTRRVAESSTVGIVQFGIRNRAEMVAGNDRNLPAGEQVRVKKTRPIPTSRDCELPHRGFVALER